MKNKKIEEILENIEKILNNLLKRGESAKENKTLKGEFKKILNNSVTNTTLHGVARIFNSENLAVKIIWLLMIMISVSSCAYLIAKNVVEYYSYPVITNIYRLHENKPPFPQVAICHHKNISTCKIDGKDCGNYIIKNTDVCHIFNSGVNQSYQSIGYASSKAAGYLFGLQLTLNLDPNKPTNIFIFNKTYNPDQKLLASPGKIQYIQIKRTLQTKLSHPYSDCQAEVLLKDRTFTDKDIIKKNNIPYAQYDCFYFYQLKEVFKLCNKTKWFNEIYQYFYTNIVYFDDIVENERKNCDGAFEKIKLKHYEYGVNELYKDYCPTECNSNTYSFTTSDTFNQALYDKNQTKLFIYYDEFYYTSISEQPKVSLDSSIGTVGGLLGLFLGASLLTTIEFLEFGINFVHILYSFIYIIIRGGQLLLIVTRL